MNNALPKKKSPLQLTDCKKAGIVNFEANSLNLTQPCKKSKQAKGCQIHATHQRGKRLKGVNISSYWLAIAFYELNHPAGGGIDTLTTRVPDLPKAMTHLKQNGLRIQSACFIAQGKVQYRYWLLDNVTNMFVKRHG